MKIKTTIGLTLFFGFMVLSQSLWAETLPEPTSIPMLTIAGDIDHTNRGAVSEFEDAYFTANGIEFDKAATFDLGMLNHFKKHSFNVKYPKWPVKESQKVTGVLLKDVLESIGAKGKTVNITALDGYSAKIDLADLEKYPVILATHLNGKPIGLGGRGPLWVVYPWNAFPELSSDLKNESLWVWSAYFMRVE